MTDKSNEYGLGLFRCRRWVKELYNDAADEFSLKSRTENMISSFENAESVISNSESKTENNAATSSTSRKRYVAELLC